MVSVDTHGLLFHMEVIVWSRAGQPCLAAGGGSPDASLASFFLHFYLIYLVVLGLSCGLRDLSSLIRDQTEGPYFGSSSES